MSYDDIVKKLVAFKNMNLGELMSCLESDKNLEIQEYTIRKEGVCSINIPCTDPCYKLIVKLVRMGDADIIPLTGLRFTYGTGNIKSPALKQSKNNYIFVNSEKIVLEDQLASILLKSVNTGKVIRSLVNDARTNKLPIDDAYDLGINARGSEFIALNEELWIAKGKEFKVVREFLGITMTRVSHAIGVSLGVIKRFESGKPINNAKIIEKSYGLLLQLETLKRTNDLFF